MKAPSEGLDAGKDKCGMEGGDKFISGRVRSGKIGLERLNLVADCCNQDHVASCIPDASQLFNGEI
jgi:hypothetical protein